MKISTSNMVRTVCTMWLEQSVQLKRSLYSAVEGCEGHNIDKRGIRVDTHARSLEGMAAGCQQGCPQEGGTECCGLEF